MAVDFAKLETRVVNGAFPLERCVGSTDASAVFLTQATRHAPSAVALKLVVADPATSNATLARWQAAMELSHPHLVRLFEAGECHLDGERYLFVRMEWADQTLEQVLERRALTETETRELLGPVVDVLGHLHARGFVHAGLKPSNVLVVRDALKLAGDTIRRADPAAAEASPAADVHALGRLLCEALTRVPVPEPLAAPERDGAPALPRGLPPAFRDVVARCLHADPARRPTVPQLRAWLDGADDPWVAQPAASGDVSADAPGDGPPAATRLVIRVALAPTSLAAAEPEPDPPRAEWRPVPIAIAAVVVLGAAWGAFRWLAGDEQSTDPGPASGSSPAVVTLPEAASAPVATPSPVPEPAVTTPPTTPPRPAVAPGTPLTEVMPKVSRSALETIRGTVRVSVRVTVAADGSVASATLVDEGPSRYFARHSLDAARGWTFAAGDDAARPSVLLRFAFTRTDVKATAEVLP